MTKAHKNDDFKYGTEGLRSVASDVGKLIMHDLSPAIFKDEKMRKSGLSPYVGDSRTIIEIYRKNGANDELIEKIKGALPTGKILFFHFQKGSITTEELCEFFNESCPLSPFSLSPSDLTFIGDKEYSPGAHDDIVHEYWAYPIDKYEPSAEKKEKKDGEEKSGGEKETDKDSSGGQTGEGQKKDIQSSFDDILKGDSELKNADVSVKIQKKADLEKYFRRDKTGLNKLDDSSDYLVIYVHGDEMDEDGAAKLVNDINDGSGKSVGSKTFSGSDIVKLGVIRRKFPASGNFENYDMFAAKVG